MGIEWFRDRLTTPLIVRVPNRAQVVGLYDNGVPVRTLPRRRVWVIGGCYLEAAPASATCATVCTECELVDRSGVPVHPSTARCKGRSYSVWSLKSYLEDGRITHRQLDNRCTR
jgi:hypothetical protein